MICHKCGSDFEGNFCSKCGVKCLYCSQCGERGTGEFCAKCGNKLNVPQNKLQQSQTNQGIVCPRCKSSNVIITPITVSTGAIETKHRGCLGWLGWILLACFTFGLVLIIPLLTNSKTKGTMGTTTYMQATCQSCSHSWRI